ncbi:hypothetical protein, partial [Ralstonia wenshanensis]|uniref:hypothetical protein n=1 Tax=Ralstonia wenshanensis TaxID=2842456 RepID=UPI002AADD056
QHDLTQGASAQRTFVAAADQYHVPRYFPFASLGTKVHSARITGEDANIEIASLHTARGGENRPQPKTTALTGRTGHDAAQACALENRAGVHDRLPRRCSMANNAVSNADVEREAVERRIV